MAFISASQAQSQASLAERKLIAAEQTRLGEKYQKIFEQIANVSAAGETRFTVRWNKAVWNDLNSILEASGYVVESPPTPAEDGVPYSDTNRIYNLTISWTAATSAQALTGLNTASFTTSRGEPFSVTFQPQGGVAPYTFTILTDPVTVPLGLSWSDLTEKNSATLSGTPSQISSGAFTLRVRDSANQVIEETISWTIESLGTIIPAIDEETVGKVLGNDGQNYLWTDQTDAAITVTLAGTITAGPSSSGTGGGIALGKTVAANTYSIALGHEISAGVNSVAIGYRAANSGQSARAVALGTNAGQIDQGTSSISIGDYAGYDGQQPQSIAIGSGAGRQDQGSYAIALGYLAGAGTGGPAQSARTIIINATGAELNGQIAQTDSLYMAPIRADSTPTSVLYYNTTTKEVTQGALNINLLAGTTLNSSITASSLTSVGTLTGLAVAGDTLITGNLTVNGITTTVNSSNLTIDDKNITLGAVQTVTNLAATLSTGTAQITLTSGTTQGLIPGQLLTVSGGTGVLGVGAVILSVDSLVQVTMTVNHAGAGAVNLAATGPSSLTANGGGLTLDNGGGGLTWTWVSTTNAWTSNVNIDIAGAGTAYEIGGVEIVTATALMPATTGSFNIGPASTGLITVGSSASTTVVQNLDRNGLDIISPNYIAVSATGSYALSTTITDNLLIVSNTGFTATLTFPGAPVDGQVLRFTVSTNTVTLALAAGPTLVGTFAGSTTANQTIEYVYRTSNTSWYRRR